MKKYILIFSALLSLTFISCEKDNFDGPNATFYGRILDVKTGALVPQDIIDGSTITAYEQGFTSPVAQRWAIKNSGEFRNEMVFANNYNIRLHNCNFFPYSEDDIYINKGKNERDFDVVPYLRVIDCEIKYDQASERIVAKFFIEPGDASVFLKSLHLYAFSDMYVCNKVHFSNFADSHDGDTYPTAVPAVNAIGYPYDMFYINVAENPTIFKKGRNYYFRVGVLAEVAGVGAVKHNYSQTVVIAL